MFITFEGIEGCGKTTQIRRLRQALKDRDIPALFTREPGGTAVGRQIRAILLDPRNKKIRPQAELFLYLADRCQHLAEKIRPALERGHWVICDRFWDATVVYQGLARGLELKTLERLRPLVLNTTIPDRTFLLDCPVEIGLARAWKRMARSGQVERESRFETESRVFHEKIRHGYLSLARKEPRRFRIVDATRSPQDIFRDILEQLFPGS